VTGDQTEAKLQFLTSVEFSESKGGGGQNVQDQTCDIVRRVAARQVCLMVNNKEMKDRDKTYRPYVVLVQH